jgi:protein-tyrosine phosphatase
VIDTHCHLLPGLDDGPRRLEEALVLARQLSAAGVRRVICTPHYSRRFPTDHAAAVKRLGELREALTASEVSLELDLAAEIAPAKAIDATVDELVARRLGETHLLVELERDTPTGFVGLLLERLAEVGLTPVLAHPERCAAVRSQPRLLDAAREQGALVQVVAPSLVGHWGEEAGAAAWRLLETGRVDLLASDAHRPGPRGLHMAVAIPLVAERLGIDALHALTERGPTQLTGPLPRTR